MVAHIPVVVVALVLMEETGLTSTAELEETERAHLLLVHQFTVLAVAVVLVKSELEQVVLVVAEMLESVQTVFQEL